MKLSETLITLVASLSTIALSAPTEDHQKRSDGERPPLTFDGSHIQIYWCDAQSWNGNCKIAELDNGGCINLDAPWVDGGLKSWWFPAGNFKCTTYSRPGCHQGYNGVSGMGWAPNSADISQGGDLGYISSVTCESTK